MAWPDRSPGRPRRRGGAGLSRWPASAAGAPRRLAPPGRPPALRRRLPHPVVWLGGAISGLEGAWNRPTLGPGARRSLGVLTLALVAGAAASAGLGLQRLCAI